MYILGKGELKQKLQELINKLDLSKNIMLLGFKTNPYAYLEKSDVFIMTSYFEGMSNSILEAFSAELPVIATDCMAGNREIIAPSTDYNCFTDKIEFAEYGILIPICHEEAESITNQEIEMANAIIKLIEDKSLYAKYKQKAKERVKYFNKENSINKWIEIIEKL